MADNDTAQDGQDDFDVPLDQPESGPGTGTQTQATGEGTVTDDQGQGQGQGEQFPADLAEALRRERLPSVPGETVTAAYSRLATHLQGRNRQLYTSIKDGERARKAEIKELRDSLEPMIREYYQRQHRAALEDAAAQIPDKETDPEGYKLWVNEEVLRRLDAAERGAEQQALTAEEQEAERQVQERLSAIDNSGYSKVAEGLGLVQGREPDPDFSHAYNVYSEAAVLAARSYWPDANDDQIQQFVALSQQLDIRRAEINGVDIRDVMKGRLNHLIDSLVRTGLVTRAQAKAAVAATGANGNGQQPEPKAPAAAREKSVVERMRTDAANANRRGPSAVPATTRASAGAGQLPDPGDLEEDDYVEAALANLLGSEEQRVGKHRRDR